MRSQFNLLPAPGTTASPEPTEAPQPAMPTAAAFSDASRGLAVGGDASGAQLWRTSDGGGTWAVSPLDTTVAGALAVSGSRAWVVVSRCPAGVQAGGPSCTTAIERSADRGATWTVIGHDDLTSIAFGDATHGFGIAHLPPPSNGDTAAGLNTAVFATADGGGTWTKLAQGRPCGPSTRCR